jgi:hypothetical protein
MAEKKKWTRPASCPAPRPRGSACGWHLYPDQRLCLRHQAADPKRQCQAKARGLHGEQVPCRAWPLVGLPFCHAHDPQLKTERKVRRESVPGKLDQARRVLQRLGRDRNATYVLSRIVEHLVTEGRLSPAELNDLVNTYAIGGPLVQRWGPL